MGATFPVLRTQVGAAKETVKGTAVAATAFPALKKFDPAWKQNKALDEGWRGSMGKEFGQQNTTRSTEIDMAGDVFVDTFGWVLGSILGSDTVTGPGPYVHTMALMNTADGQPTSQTWTDNEMGIQGRQYPGAQCTELTIKFDASGLLNFDAKYLSFIGATSATPAASYSTLVPVPSFLGALTIAGSGVTSLESMEIALKRENPEAIFTIGSQDPYQVHVGGLSVTTKCTFVAQDESRLLSYLNNTQEAVVVTFTQSAGQILKLQMTQHYFDDSKLMRGKSYATVEATGKAMFNTTDATVAGGGLSPIQAVLTNGVATGVYI